MREIPRLGARASIAMATAVAVLITAPAATVAAEDEGAPIAGAAELAGPPELRGFADDLVVGLDPSTHGGVSVDVDSRTVTLMIVRGRDETSLRAKASALRPADGVTVRTKVVDRSTAELEQLRDYGIWQRLPKELRSQVTATQIDVAHNRVVVGLDTITPAARRRLKNVFGDAASVRREGRALATNRYGDVSPYYGGDRLLISYTGSAPFTGACTSGFGATYQGVNVMVMAGHCAPYGVDPTPTNVRTGALYSENGCSNVPPAPCPGAAFGTVWQTRTRTYATPAEASSGVLSVDLALIRTSTLPFTWQAGSNSIVTALVSFPGAERTPSGSACFTGATSWGYCGFAVQAGLLTRVISLNNRYYRAQVWRALPTDSIMRVCGGDSGGTVYNHFDSRGESILGVVSATTGASRGSVVGQSCGSELLFTYWGQGRAVYPAYLPQILT